MLTRNSDYLQFLLNYHNQRQSEEPDLSTMKTIKVTFCQKAEEYYRDINDYKGDWPGIKFSSSLQCKFQCNLNVHALFLLSYCPLSYQYAYISSKSGILKIIVFELNGCNNIIFQ